MFRKRLSSSSLLTFPSSGFLFPPVSFYRHQITVYLLHTSPPKTCSLLLCIGPTSQKNHLILCAQSELLPTTKKSCFSNIFGFPSLPPPSPQKAPLPLSCSPLQGHACPLSSPALTGWSRVLYLACFALRLLRCGRILGHTSAAFPAEQGAIYSQKQL